MLKVENLYYTYGNNPVLKNISFGAQKGELVMLLGPNGAGKTTLLQCAFGSLPGLTGNVFLNGNPIKHLSGKKLAANAAYLPQAAGTPPPLTAFNSVLLGTAGALPFFATPGPAQHTAALAAMGKVGIAHLAGRLLSTLSGGEVQLTRIARALASGAPLLLLDEPAAGLDLGAEENLLKHIKTLAHYGCCVLLSTHNPNHALRFADKVLALKNGNAVAFGPPETTLTPALLSSLYTVPLAVYNTGAQTFVLPKIEKQDN